MVNLYFQSDRNLKKNWTGWVQACQNIKCLISRDLSQQTLDMATSLNFNILNSLVFLDCQARNWGFC